MRSSRAYLKTKTLGETVYGLRMAGTAMDVIDGLWARSSTVATTQPAPRHPLPATSGSPAVTVALPVRDRS